MDSTSKFHEAISYAVLQASPPLAALYTASFNNTHTKSPDWCSKCGSYLLHGNAEIRVTRLKNQDRALRKSCRACGFANDISLEALPPSSIYASRPVQSTSTAPNSLIPTSLNPPIHNLSPATQNKSRPKKKTGLQDLLSKNREKKEKERLREEHQQPSDGLAAFLRGL